MKLTILYDSFVELKITLMDAIWLFLVLIELLSYFVALHHPHPLSLYIHSPAASYVFSK